MRAALSIADPTDILLDRFAMAGEPRPIWSRTIGLTIPGPRLGWNRFAGARPTPPSSSATPRRDDELFRIGNDRIAKLDLETEDWRQAGFLIRGRGPDDAVQALMVGDREPGQAQLDRSLGELVGRRCPIQEREVRVAMELGVGRHQDR
jgi:hypothetical protein